MNSIKVIVGANYGNEGKGLITNYFCNKTSRNSSILNIKLTGLYNNGHMVINGSKKHVFKQIGAGSFNDNVDTYLGENFILKANALIDEVNSLNKLGISYNYNRIFIHKNAKINLDVDKLLCDVRNNEDEYSELYETIKRSENIRFRLLFSELGLGDTYIKDKLYDIVNIYTRNELKDIGYKNDEIDNTLSKIDIDREFGELKFIWENIKNIDRDELLIRSYDLVIFEGNYGLMLDNNLLYLKTGLGDIAKFINESSLLKEDIEICYVTRSYIHRSGAGKLKNEVDSNEISCTIEKSGIRFGLVDSDYLKEIIENDIENIKTDKHLSLCVTHLDETDGMIATIKGKVYIDELDLWNIFEKVYMSFGDKAEDIIVDDIGRID